MTEEANLQGFNSTDGSDRLPFTRGGRSADLIPADLYGLVMWGFAEQNSLGQRVLRRDIQARLDGSDDMEGQLNDLEGNPLYVGYRCQACWEAAVTVVIYGQHLCAWDTRTIGVLPRQSIRGDAQAVNPMGRRGRKTDRD